MPKLTYIDDYMSDEIRHQVMQRVLLGGDQHISEESAPREKAIRFVTVNDGQVSCLSQNYFVQNEAYNEKTGGYKRFYNLIGEEVVQELLQESMLEFLRYYDLPNKTVVLIQIQTSNIGILPKMLSVTGQGIHTDGADRALLVCLHRGEGVKGAHNQFHATLDGLEPLSEAAPLMPGNAVLWKDNEIYHYVTRAQGSRGLDNTRTIMIMHAPASMYLQGAANPNNETNLNESKANVISTFESYYHDV